MVNVIILSVAAVLFLEVVKRRNQTGKSLPVLSISLSFIVVVGISAFYILGQPLTVDASSG